MKLYNNFRFIFSFCLFSFFTCFFVFSQKINVDANAGITQDGIDASVSITIGGNGNNSTSTEEQYEPYPSGFRSVSLGMNVDDVKQALLEDSIYGYRGERDVSLLPTENRVLIETAGLSFFNRSWFQFYEDKLYTIIFKLDDERVDFYSIFNSLQEKYGEPTSLSPEKIVWKDESVTLSLERPLILKYIDTRTFETIQHNSKVDKNIEEVTRKGFLDNL